jgi:hypothetical protein
VRGVRGRCWGEDGFVTVGVAGRGNERYLKHSLPEGISLTDVGDRGTIVELSGRRIVEVLE